MRLWLGLVTVFVLAGTGGVEAGTMKWEVTTCAGRRYVPVDNVAAFYQMRMQVAGKKFTLVRGSSRIEGTAGARFLMINGVKYVLCFPMETRGGETLISAMDVTKIIEPVLRPQKIKNATAVKTVILDPGHGGHDSGATGRMGVEKEAALDVALRTKRHLEKKGFDVKLTRSRDLFIPLDGRSAYANKYQNAIFVSIHFNKSRGSSGTGIETYCLAPRGVPSMDEEHLSYSDLKRHPGHARDPENIALATAIHSAMVRNLNLPDRGIKRARFHVIRETAIPSILVEGGFMNNPLDSRMIASSAYRERMAASIAHGVDLFRAKVNGKAVTAPPSVVASAADETRVPDLRRGTIGADTDASAAISAAAKALAN